MRFNDEKCLPKIKRMNKEEGYVILARCAQSLKIEKEGDRDGF